MLANRSYSGPQTDHFDGTRFFNPGHPSTDRGMAALLRWRFGGGRAAWPAAIPGRQTTLPPQRVQGLRVTLVGHASVLIQAAGVNLLVDPVWSSRASPFRRVGPRRVNPPAIAFEDLPPIDAVLLTHNHYDHLDVATLRRLWAAHDPRVIAPLGNEAVIRRAASSMRLATLDWRGSERLGQDCVVRLHPAHHWSRRGIGDRRMALWGGYVIATSAGTIYVAGDTGYGDGAIFRELRERHEAPDVAILPIGAYAPRWFMKAQHVDPAEAVQIMLDCGAAQALGVHWGTFRLTDEGRWDPKTELQRELRRRDLPGGRFLAMEAGDVWSRAGPADEPA